MSLVPDKIRKSKKIVDSSKLDAFVDEGLAGQTRRQEGPPSKGAQETAKREADEVLGNEATRSDTTKNEPRAKARRKTPAAPATSWKQGIHRAPSVAFSVRIPTPLLERMRDVVAAVDGESLTSLLVEGASARVEEIEATYSEQVGQELPTRRRKIEL